MSGLEHAAAQTQQATPAPGNEEVEEATRQMALVTAQGLASPAEVNLLSDALLRILSLRELNKVMRKTAETARCDLAKADPNLVPCTPTRAGSLYSTGSASPG